MVILGINTPPGIAEITELSVAKNFIIKTYQIKKTNSSYLTQLFVMASKALVLQ
jgi:hypothetical protein